MAVATVVRYTGSALDLTLALGLLGVAAVHAAVGAPTAFLPAIGGFGLLGAAVALAPLTRRRFRQNALGRDDMMLLLGTLIVATLTLSWFIALAYLF